MITSSSKHVNLDYEFEGVMFLRIPLLKLFYINDMSGFTGLNEAEVNGLNQEYTEEELDNIKQALDWAEQNPDFDFSSLLPNLKQSNVEIYEYLQKVNRSFLIH